MKEREKYGCNLTRAPAGYSLNECVCIKDIKKNKRQAGHKNIRVFYRKICLAGRKECELI